VAAALLLIAASAEWAALWVTLALVTILIVTVVPSGRRLLAMVGYFTVINAASMVGLVRGTLGRVSGIWATPRQGDAAADIARTLVPVGPVLLLSGALLLAVAAMACNVSRTEPLSPLVFWVSVGLLAYVYAGYPLLLAAMKSIGPRPVRRAAVTPKVCLFIAANDEGAVLRAKLENSLAADYPAELLDIVVASDGSVDQTNAIAAAFAPRVRLLEYSPRRGKISVINDGMLEVTSDIVIFSDANTFLASDAIRAIVRNFADPEVGGVSGDVALVGERAALGRSEDLYYRYERWIQHAESEVGSMIGADGALYAIRRELFAPAHADTILDDLSIPMAVLRTGRRVVYEPNARAYEHGSESAREEFARKTRVVAGAVQFLSRADSAVPVDRPQVILSLLSHKGLRWLSPVYATCAFLASVALADASHAYAAAAFAQAILVAFGLLGCIPALRRVAVIAVAHYFCLVQAAALVGFVRGISGRQSGRWRRFAHATEPERLHVV
jgi:hypothetical protein